MWIPCRNRMSSGVNLPVSAVLVLALIGFWWRSWCEIFWLLSDVNFTTNLEMQNLLWILIRLILDHVVVWKFSAIFLVLVILSSVSGETEENKKRIILSVLRYWRSKMVELFHPGNCGNPNCVLCFFSLSSLSLSSPEIGKTNFFSVVLLSYQSNRGNTRMDLVFILSY